MLARYGIKLLVCDMAGTVINEKNIVYRTLDSTLRRLDIVTSEEQQRRWHGQTKTQVLRTMISHHRPEEASTELLIEESERVFNRELERAYFEDEGVELMDPKVLDLFEDLRCHGTKVALNTGYSSAMQRRLCDHLQLTHSVDAMVAADEVTLGRPYPYMIHRLMECCGTKSSREVAKVGDTLNDVLEGRNARCGLVLGVLSGAGKRSDFASADRVLNSVLEVTYAPQRMLDFSIPLYLGH